MAKRSIDRSIWRGAVRYLPAGVFMQLHCECGGMWWHRATRRRKVACVKCGKEAVLTSVSLRDPPPNKGCFGNCAR